MNLGEWLGDISLSSCNPSIILKIFIKMYGVDDALISAIHFSRQDGGGIPWIPTIEKIKKPDTFIQFVKYVNISCIKNQVVHYILVGYSGSVLSTSSKLLFIDFN